MPPRNARKNNRAANNVQQPRQPQPQPAQRPLAFSPPTQLPTPLPDEHIAVSAASLDLLNFPGEGGAATLSHLIDFDTPTPPPQPFSPLQDSDMDSSLLSEDLQRDEAAYRSPPYREARLPEESPPPLPILPRFHQRLEATDDEQEERSGGAPGNSRAPTFSRISAPSPTNAHVRYPSNSHSSSTFDSLSRTIRGYVPTAAPSAPRVSRPVSYALFSGSPTVSQVKMPSYTADSSRSPQYAAPVSRQEFERDYERDDADDAYYGYGGYPASPPPPHPSALPNVSPPLREQDRNARFQSQAGRPREQQHTHQRQSSGSSRFMGSGLAQAIRRGAAAGAGVVVSRAASAAGLASQTDTGRKEDEPVLWAEWDVLNDRRVLIIAYSTGIQMWDCADLGALHEVFNLNLASPEWAMVIGSGGAGGHKVRVVHAAVLPWTDDMDKDVLRDARPVMGMILESGDGDEREHEPQSVFVVYSLRTHQVVKMRRMSGLSSTFIANENFIVIGTTTPPNLHILSSTTFHTLHIINSAQLEPYSTPTHTTPTAISITNAISNTAQSTSVSLGLSIDTQSNNINTNGGASGKSSPEVLEAPRPIFALSRRLLAYASAPNTTTSPQLATAGSNSSRNSKRLSTSSVGSASSNAPSSLSSSPFGIGIGKITNMTQADVGHAALKVGESVFSGMKFLGGMALEAAKSRVSSNAPVGPEGRLGAFGSPGTRSAEGGLSASPGSARAVSRSAPGEESAFGEDIHGRRERRYSNMSNLSTGELRAGSSPNSPSPHLTTVAPSTRPSSEHGHYVTVLDLSPLLLGKAPMKIDEFNVSRSQSVARISFAADGTSVAAVLRDGHAVRVFKLQPKPRVLVQAQAATEGSEGVLEEPRTRRATHVYDLYRGRTSAVVEGLAWAGDGRWMAVGTRNRTVHVFGINPYGGKPDVRSHVEGRVRNVDVVEPRLEKLQALVRLRGSRISTEQNPAPLAFVFISPADVASAPNLAFPFAPPPITNSPSFSPPKLTRGTNYQDVLVFDPIDCVLSLRRLTIDKQAVKEPGGLGASVHAALGATSISLPGMGGAGRLSGGTSTRAGESGVKGSGVGAPAEVEIVAKAGVEATWDLKRGRDAVEIKTPIMPKARGRMKAVHSADWLAGGEISTCSSSTRVLPRSLYLSHQFSFHTLGEDYHALIRRHQFDIAGAKIEVRRLVEISAYTSGGGDSAFVEGFSSPRDIRRASSSFDEPIASAISGSLDSSNLPPILPMYPNGVPGGSKPRSFRATMPIRTMAQGLGDGMSESLGRIRREMHKTTARSPQLGPRADSSLGGPVPLEFDEEDFLSQDVVLEVDADTDSASPISREASSRAIDAALDRSTRQLMDADVLGTMEEDLWNGWEGEDKLAVEEAERFHDLSELVVEEVAAPVIPPPAVKAGKKGRKKR